MRPRPDAAENPTFYRARPAGAGRASMRPRPDAAENQTWKASTRTNQTGFNEAAARCRGKPRRRAGRPAPDRQASMRPRPDAAENRRESRGEREGVAGASMRPRPDAAENRSRRSRPCSARRPRFNEAAARCRGKPPIPPSVPVRRAHASMRPRPDAAENPPGRRRGGRLGLASMRPRPDAAENQPDERRQPAGAEVASMRPRPDAAENPSRGGSSSNMMAMLQ